MEPTETRVHTYTSHGAGTIDVTGQTGHLLNTDTYISRRFKAEVRVQEEEKDTDYTFSTPETSISALRRGNLPLLYNGAVGGAPASLFPYSFGTTNLAMNKSIEKLVFYPLTSRNSLDVRPRLQAELLPYLAETQAVSNLNMSVSSMASSAANTPYTQDTKAGSVVAAPDEADLYRCRLDTQRVFLIKTTAAQTVVQVLNAGHRMQGTLAGGTHLVSMVAAPEAVYDGIPMVTNPTGPAGAAHAANSEYIAGGPAGTTKRRFMLNPNNFQLRLDPGEFGITDGGGQPFTAANGALTFDLSNFALVDRPVFDEFDQDGYSVLKKDPDFAGPLPEYLVLRLWTRDEAQHTHLVSIGGLNVANSHLRIQATAYAFIELLLPRHRFLRGVAQPERLNPFLKAVIPHTVQAGVRLGPSEPSLLNGINYANIISLNEDLAENLRYFQQIGHDRNLLNTVLYSVGSVRPYIHETVSTIAGGAPNVINVMGNHALRGIFPEGPLATQLEAIRVGALPGTTPFMFVVRYGESMVRDPLTTEWFDDTGPALVPPQAGGNPENYIYVEKSHQVRFSLVMFTKRCIVQANAPAGTALYIRGIPVGAGQPAAVYGALDFQVQAGRTMFRTITHTAAIGFATSFTKVPAHAEFENGAVGGRDMGQFWHQAAGAPPQNYTRYTIADDYYNFENGDLADNGNVVRHPNFQTFLEHMGDALRGEAFVFQLPTRFFDRDQPVVRSEILGVNPADGTGSRLTEPLLGFAGMSVFRPSSIYPTLPKLPAFVQDYRMVLSQPPSQRMLIDTIDSQLHVANVTDRLITHVVPVGEYEVTVRSDNGFKQENKELQSASIPFPWTQDFFSSSVVPTLVANKLPAIPRCECSTPYAPPDYVFIRLQRMFRNNVRTAPFEATIKTLRMYVRTHNIRTISDLDETQLYQLTRRNSNFRADTLGNFRKYGAVLIRRQDVGSWPDWDGEKDDPFTIEFQVNDYDVYNATEATGYPAAITDTLNATPLRVAVTFIYSKYGFAGKYNDCQFDFSARNK